ncbi:facilitated trehalose transporter Tret1-like isoform X2 [Sipha flava]|nr:facilitated trehalose transporter Tret1-like isoform X2 [Sipha flava]
MLVTQPGINMVYSNIFLNHYKFTDISDLSWLTSILVVCTPIGTIAIGVIMDRIGRKNAFLVTCVPLLISWSIASVVRPEDMSLIYACRVFAGIGGGMTSMVIIYVSEIAHASYRQVLLSLNSVFFSVGVLFATTVGSFFKWQMVNMIFLIFTAVITVLLVIFLPESPIWLAKFRASRVYEAKNSLKRIYPINDQVYVDELNGLDYVRKPPTRPATTITIAPDPSEFDNGPTTSRPLLSTVRLSGGTSRSHERRRGRLRRLWRQLCMCGQLRLWSPQPPTVTRPVRVLAIVFLLQQLSGCYPVIFYAVPVIRTVMGVTDLDAADGQPSQMDALIALGVVRLLASVVACMLSPHVGRRPLMIASSLAMACSAALVALTCPLPAAAGPRDDYDGYETIYPTAGPPPVPLLPLIGIAAFVCSGSAGVIVFPWTLVGELLPVSVRATGGALLVAYAYTLMFIVQRVFPCLVALDADVSGGRGRSSVAAAFAMFAAVSLALALYTHASLPETLGKRFKDIERYFADPSPTCLPVDFSVKSETTHNHR